MFRWISILLCCFCFVSESSSSTAIFDLIYHSYQHHQGPHLFHRKVKDFFLKEIFENHRVPDSIYCKSVVLVFGHLGFEDPFDGMAVM